MQEQTPSAVKGVYAYLVNNVWTVNVHEKNLLRKKNSYDYSIQDLEKKYSVHFHFDCTLGVTANVW